jgi:hypothetical protein
LVNSAAEAAVLQHRYQFRGIMGVVLFFGIALT